MTGDLHTLSVLLWAVLFILFLSLTVMVMISSRGVRLLLTCRIRRDQPATRRSLRLAMYTAGVMLVSAFSLETTASESWTTRLMVLAIAVVVGAVAFRWSWSRLTESARRRMDESAYWQRRALEVNGALDTIESGAEVRGYVIENLVNELGLQACALYERCGEEYRCTCSVPEGAPAEPWPASALLPETLAGWLAPNSLEVASALTGRPVRWSLTAEGDLESEQERLQARDVRIAIGFRRSSGPAGFLLLSARAGNEPFSMPQQRFAESLAAHLGRSLDAVDRLDRLMGISREIERETQERAVLLRARGFLAPPERPEVPGVEYAWNQWRGQYPGNSMLDALSLPNRSLGLVLAEAEGSDLEAAIRLVQLQALLRSRFWAYADDLRELLESTERALLAAHNESRPLRLFCARYRPLTRTLHYVNAGYYAPMLLRVHAKGADIIRLSSRSGPLCDTARPALVEEEIDLQHGDLLAIASPGVAAARSPQKELWGENRLADTLLSWEGQPVQDIARLTLHTAEEYSGKATDLPPRILILMRLQPVEPPHAQSS